MRALLFTILFSGVLASAQSLRCNPDQSRALVLSGGGARGAFAAGAIYHLVVDRHCDFKDISGVSVGALNGAVLAQALTSSDPVQSLKNLGEQAEELVAVWDSIKGTRDIFKKRFLGMLRFGLFRSENVNDFTPLQNLIQAKVSSQRLLTGRALRVGVVSFWDGRYREIVASKTSEQENQKFLEFVFASSLIPISGRMPQIQDDPAITDKRQWTQFADPGLRRVTPLSSFFRTCAPTAVASDKSPINSSLPRPLCDRTAAKLIPDHEGPIEQIFVIVSSPYSRASDKAESPNLDTCCQKGTRQFTDGYKILERTLSLTVGIPYRWDLDFGQFANDFLRWREQQHNVFLRATDPSKAAQFQEESSRLNGNSPVESYNPDNSAELPSLPYDLRFIVAQKVFAGVYGLDPPGIREQLYCGCVAADQMMSNGDSSQSMSSQCVRRFPKLPGVKTYAADWDSEVCIEAPAHH